MRITNNMMANRLLYNLANNLTNMTNLNRMTSDGKRVHRPSDDPVSIAKILKFNTDLGEIEQYKRNITDALGMYKVAESAIQDMESAIARIRDLTVQAANSATLAPEDMEKIKSEVKELKKHLVSAGNFSYAGKYVFSGHQSDKPLFKTVNVAGVEEVYYNVDITEGDGALPQKKIYLVGHSETISVGTNGIELFGLDESDNVYTSMYTDTAGDQFEEGINFIKARFNSDLDYTGDNLDVTVGGTTYSVDVTALDGTTNPIDKAVILDRFKNAPAGGGRLTDVAEVYFDSHNNLVISARNSGDTVSCASTNIKFATSEKGISAKKSQLIGEFVLDGPNSDYRTQNLNVTIGGSTYNVDESELTGNGFELKKEKVLEEFRNAVNGGGQKLSEVADIFFDEKDRLVIKERNYGNLPIAMVAPTSGFNPTFTAGNNASEASVSFGDFPLNDAYIAAHEDELKSTPIFILYNGSRYRITLDSTATINTVASYVTELQTAIDKSVGSGKIDVSQVGGTMRFETTNTPDGVTPEIRVEPVITNRSSLLNDVDNFIAALENYDQPAINQFLGDIDEHHNRILATRADLGAKTSRLELAVKRTEDNELSFTEALSVVEDVDMAEAILQLKIYESVYNASLSTGTKIIQPSLVDFIR